MKEAPAPVMKTEYDDVQEYAVQNNDKPIWVRAPKDVEKASYDEFFKSTFKEFLDPLAYNHFAVEGDIEFRSILYVPGMAPFEQQDMMARSKAIKLYVRRVFISDEFDDSILEPLPDEAADVVGESIGGAIAVAEQAPVPALGDAIVAEASDAYTTAFHVSLTTAAVLAAVVGAVVFVAGRGYRPTPSPEVQPVEATEQA